MATDPILHASSGPSSSRGKAVPTPPASHTAFILGQVRSGLAHLNKTHALDDDSFERIDGILTQKVDISDRVAGPGGESRDVDATSLDTLGKRNAWLRETLVETSLLSNLVDTALSIGVPSAILSSSQREAIVLLVERSQGSIAKAVTDPKYQKRAQSGALSTAKGGFSGLRKGINAAGQGVQDLATKRQEAKERAEEKRAEKEDAKQLKRELKEERKVFLQERQRAALAGHDASSATTGGMNTSSKAHESAQIQVPQQTEAKSRQKMRDEREKDGDDNGKYIAQTLAKQDYHQDDSGAMASVACNRLHDHDESDNAVSATTTFSPWPGLLLSSTIVAVSDEPVFSPALVARTRHDQAYHAESSMSRALPPPPQRRPASHQETERGSRGTAESLIHASDKQGQQVPLTGPPRETPAPPPPARDFAAPVTQSMPTAPAAEPSVPSSAGAPTSSTPSQANEMRDVTDSKQKGWARKLGL